VGTTETNQYSIEEEIKRGWKPENVCYHSMQSLVSSSFLFKVKVYGSITLPVVLYRCETWSLTLREERRLRMFENSLLSIIFRPMRDEVTGEWIKLYKEELNDLNSSPNIAGVIKSRREKWAGHVAGMGEEKCLQTLVVKPEGKRTHGRHRHRWEDNIKIYLHGVVDVGS
jgi:hypothetical protein